jgi:hypothetical protein
MKDYTTIIIGTHPADMQKYLIKYETEFVVTTQSYTDSALLAYRLGGYFPVFGGGSQHGRQDDMITDYRKFNGKNIMILRGSEPRVNEYSTLFKNISVESIVVDEARFFLVCGYDFSYENYRNIVLKDIKDKYYNIPSWLPRKSGASIMKYFENN